MYSKVCILIATIVMLSFSAACGIHAETSSPPALNYLQKNLQSLMNKMDEDLRKAASELSATGLEGDGARSVLRRLCSFHYSVYDCATVDGKGRIRAIEPGVYRKYEGKDISTQEQVVRLQRTGRPVLSSIFRAVEGIYAADLEYPVFSPSGELMGSVSMLFRPESLIGSVVVNEIKGLPLDAWALQWDGRILFDLNPGEIGRSLTENPSYRNFPGLVDMAKKMQQQREGHGEYSMSPGGPSNVDVYWITVGLHGTEWRMAISKMKASDRGGREKPAKPRGFRDHDDSLRILASDPKLQQAMSFGSNLEVYEMLKAFFQDHGNLYSVQWIDEKGLNRFGYPDENSLLNYDCSSPDSIVSGKMMAAVKGRKEVSCDVPLVEGRMGHILMVPVSMKGAYLGMIYTITINP